MQFLGKGSTRIQSFVYHFVENIKLFHENVKFFHSFHCVSDIADIKGLKKKYKNFSNSIFLVQPY